MIVIISIVSIRIIVLGVALLDVFHYCRRIIVLVVMSLVVIGFVIAIVITMVSIARGVLLLLVRPICKLMCVLLPLFRMSSIVTYLFCRDHRHLCC